MHWKTKGDLYSPGSGKPQRRHRPAWMSGEGHSLLSEWYLHLHSVPKAGTWQGVEGQDSWTVYKPSFIRALIPSTEVEPLQSNQLSRPYIGSMWIHVETTVMVTTSRLRLKAVPSCLKMELKACVVLLWEWSKITGMPSIFCIFINSRCSWQPRIAITNPIAKLWPCHLISAECSVLNHGLTLGCHT